MSTVPDRRFVRVRLPDHDGHRNTMTFLASDPRDATHARDNGVVRHVAQQDPEKAEALATLLAFLKEHEETFFRWLEEDPQHSTAFARDPVATIRSILPQAPFPE